MILESGRSHHAQLPTTGTPPICTITCDERFIGVSIWAMSDNTIQIVYISQFKQSSTHDES